MQKQILVVEDQRLIAMDIARRLKRLGYLVGGMASSGTCAIRYAEDLHPDLILMDVTLGGGMDGIQLADYIGKRLQIPIVFVSGYGDQDTLERAKKATGMRGFLAKPFDDDELGAAIEAALVRV